MLKRIELNFNIMNKFLDKTFNKFFLFNCIFSIALISIILISEMGIAIPFIQTILGFIVALIIPGFLIIKILKLKEIHFIETGLYSIGLSLGLMMLLGFILNITLPEFGNNKPLSIWPIVIGIIILNIVLFGIYYYFINDNSNCQKIFFLERKHLKNPFALYGILLILISYPWCVNGLEISK